MRRNNRVDTFHATATNFYSVYVKILCRTWLVEKCFFSNFRNTLPTFVFTLFEQGGLNQMIFLLRILLLLFASSCTSFGKYLGSSVKPLSLSALLYILVDLLNISSLDDVSDICLAIDFGSCFKIFGGWFKFLLIQMWILLGF